MAGFWAWGAAWGAAAALLAGAAGAAWALSADEVMRLKKAGVSDAVIQKMMEQEEKGAADRGPLEERREDVIYRAGQGVRGDLQRNRQHEAWKEKKSLEALPGVVVDQRKRSGGSAAGTGTPATDAGK